ncbi:MAG: 2-amino-4-hydroxy-6-hydroxymethyldihydropteridine diphosphokinase [Actinomycetota bacterium]|nr:2-amino-4-hydroxy-6-hydroxymethyldihydropteridine diphosphokinase [Actinomycetota bacterium]
MRSTVVLSLGSNLGDRLSHLRLAVAWLADIADVLGSSPVYETEPWGGVEQPDFLNAVLVVRSTSLDEWGWLRLGQELETRAGRVREVRWGPRTLDVDVVAAFGPDGAAIVSEHPELRLPHPGAAIRNTVLRPWLDIDPDAELPGYGRVEALLAAVGESGMRRRDELGLLT